MREAEIKVLRELRAIANSTCSTANNTGGTTGPNLSIDNRHLEVLDANTITLTGLSSYSYSVLSGSATITINGVTISGIPTGFDARQGDTTPNTLLNDITIVGDSLGTRVIVYYEL